jgi:hypothetical protein
VASPDEEIARLTGELEKLGAEAETLTSQVAGTAIVPVGESATAVKLRLASARKELARTAAAIRARGDELREAMLRKQHELTGVLEPMRTQIARLEEGIQAVNLYLGRDEDLVQLADGASAPADTPIVVRQQVLAMDEECAVAAEEGGIDHQSIDEFDAWLLEDPAHLDQVLPEQKGVVALMPRRSDVDYGDPWVSARKNEANHQTYFLVRNGERLYRTTIDDFRVGARLVPARDEFTSFFTRRRYDNNTRSYVHEEIRPGSWEWEEAEEKAEAHQRHYMRVALVLQGLVDRTAVFHPLPVAGLSLLGPDAYDAGHVVIVLDDEHQLGTGKQAFKDWLRETNRELRPGMRIIGAFGSSTFKYLDGDYGHSRIPTSRWASWPDSLVLHTIVDRGKRGGFVFRYDRTDLPSWSEGHKRASCLVFADDEFILAVDRARVEDMERFLRSRTDRKHYASMFPVLKAAIAVKRAEAEEEAPFRQLLAGTIATRNDVSVGEAEADVADLVDWWKFANRHHRPLVGLGDLEQRQTIDSICAEHKRRLADRARAGVDAALVTRLRERHPGAILVARKRSGALIVLVPSAAGQTVFVDEYESTARGEPKASSTWRLVGSRAARWTVLWEAEQWATWDKTASLKEHLTGPEIEALAAEIVEQFDADNWGELVAVTYWPTSREDDWDDWHRHFQVYAREAKSVVPKSVWKPAEAPKLYRHTFKWRRTTGNVPVLDNAAGRYKYGFDLEHGRKVSDPLFDNLPLLYLDERLLADLHRDSARYTEAAQIRRAWSNKVWSATASVREAWRKRELEAARVKFIDDFLDADLWEDHRKTVRIDYPYNHERETWVRNPDNLAALIRPLLLANVAIAGMTVADAVDKHREIAGDPPEIPEDLLDLAFSRPVDEDEDEEEHEDDEDD